MYRLSILLLFLTMTIGLQAQGFRGGFKAGLNFSHFDGPLERDAQGNEVESLNLTTGFHIGAIFAYAITDLAGVKAELMYSQKGTEIEYDGPSFFFFYSPSGQSSVQVGSRNASIDITNSYISVPVSGFFRLGRLEVEGGAYASVLVSSFGSGGAEFTRQNGSQFIVSYDYNFFSDEVGVEAVIEGENAGGGSSFVVPRTINAYYESLTNDNRFKRMDFGLIGGLSFFVNEGLFLGGRVVYGLSDVTSREQDLALSALSANQERVFRDDKDRNVSYQASIGFRF